MNYIKEPTDRGLLDDPQSVREEEPEIPQDELGIGSSSQETEPCLKDSSLLKGTIETKSVADETGGGPFDGLSLSTTTIQTSCYLHMRRSQMSPMLKSAYV
jgi:hypothetical protein